MKKLLEKIYEKISIFWVGIFWWCVFCVIFNLSIITVVVLYALFGR